jgi:hypothetical protein
MTSERRWLRRPWGAEILGLLFLLVVFVVPSALVWYRVRGTQAARRVAEERVGPLAPGMSQEALRRRAGEPDEVCQDGFGFLDGYLVESSRHRDRTAHMWIYYSGGAGRVARNCRPAYNDTVLGLSQEGTLIWFIRFMGESAFEAGGG